MNAPNPARPRTESQMLVSVLRGEIDGLNEALDQMIGSRCNDEFGVEDFVKALKTIRSVRLALEAEVDKLVAAETAVSQ